jgi:dihydroxyacetone kinase-like predicted kinase
MGKTNDAAKEKDMLEFKFDTQLLIEGENLSEDAVNEYITNNIEGDCLLAVGDPRLIKIHFHTNTPWKVLEYCASIGEIYDVVIENMERQENGLQG